MKSLRALPTLAVWLAVLCAASPARARRLLDDAPAPAPVPSSPAQPFSLPPLPYYYSALEPWIDTETMQLHHDKHHQAAVDKLNAAVANRSSLWFGGDVSQLVRLAGTDAVPAEIAEAVRNNAGGHYNHQVDAGGAEQLFWTLMAPKDDPEDNQPVGELADAIWAQYDSFDAFKQLFNEAAVARSGCGWAWLIIGADKRLSITTTPNQDGPLMAALVPEPGTPVLVVDVHEHAYYLLHRNRRQGYLDSWWNVTNWEQANEYYAAALANY